ncbi:MULTISPECIES: protealysin inhibitor emfourin [Bacteria]|uniref:protealysin inhibitor emfourin n=1 Tax=Bacteria TaxID=2 RepID=UPI003C7A322E
MRQPAPGADGVPDDREAVPPPADGDAPGPESSSPRGDDGRAGTLAIIVVRTGGIAGLRREWRVEPPHEQARRWAELVERCPWESPLPAADGADRFVWRIVAHLPSGDRARDVPEAQLTGPWRSLVDAVRDAAD